MVRRWSNLRCGSDIWPKCVPRLTERRSPGRDQRMNPASRSALPPPRARGDLALARGEPVQPGLSRGGLGPARRTAPADRTAGRRSATVALDIEEGSTAVVRAAPEAGITLPRSHPGRGDPGCPRHPGAAARHVESGGARVLGPRVEALPVRRLIRHPPPDLPRDEVAHGFWYRLAHSIMRRPVACTAGVLTVLPLAAAPFLRPCGASTPATASGRATTRPPHPNSVPYRPVRRPTDPPAEDRNRPRSRLACSP